VVANGAHIVNRRHSYSRPILALAGAVGVSGAAACGGTPDASESTQSSAANFVGPYVTTGPGDIAGMEFHGREYTLTPTGCTTASCVDLGTYSLDSVRSTLTLTSSKTGTETTTPITILEASPSASLTSAEQIQPRGGAPQGQLEQPGETLSEPDVDLLAQKIHDALLPKGPKGQGQRLLACDSKALPFGERLKIMKSGQCPN
jgi:hypothetical protein